MATSPRDRACPCGKRRRTVRFAAAFVATVLCGAALVSGAQADDAVDDSGPSWSEIDEAKKDIAATEALVSQINDALAADQRSADAAGDAAVAAAAEANAAKQKSDAASIKLGLLDTQLAIAQAQYSGVVKAAGAVIVSETRSGAVVSSDLQVFLSAHPDDALAALTMNERVSQIAGGLVQRAQAAKANVSSLAENAAVQADALTKLSDAATRAATKAEAENTTANDAVNRQTTTQKVLYEKLAALKNTTATNIATLKKKEAAAAAYKEQQEAAAAAASHNSPTPATPAAPTSAATPSSTPSKSPTKPTTPTASASAPPSNPGSGSGGATGGGTSGGGSATGNNTVAAAKAYAKSKVSARGWKASQYTCLVSLWNRESGWRYDATNPSSGAYGIPQALPGSKMSSAGSDWRTNARTQIDWGLGYIADRYTNPCGAWQHSEDTGWY